MIKQSKLFSKFIGSRRSILPILYLLFLFGMYACDNKATSAGLRAINLSPDTESMDVFDDDSTLFSPVYYSQSTEYTTISNEKQRSHQIKVTPTNSFTVFSDQSKTFKSMKDYTLFLFDFAEKATVTYELDDISKLSSGRASLRFVHGAPSSESVDLYVTFPDDSLQGLTPTIESVSFKRISPYIENVEGDYRIRATIKGTLKIVADSGVVSLSSGKIYTVALADKLGGGTPFEIVVFSDN